MSQKKVYQNLPSPRTLNITRKIKNLLNLIVLKIICESSRMKNSPKLMFLSDMRPLIRPKDMKSLINFVIRDNVLFWPAYPILILLSVKIRFHLCNYKLETWDSSQLIILMKVAATHIRNVIWLSMTWNLHQTFKKLSNKVITESNKHIKIIIPCVLHKSQGQAKVEVLVWY